MTTEKMTIHKALAELKTMDSRINKAIYDADCVVAVKHSAEKINGMTIKDFKDKIVSDYQKVNDLIKRREAMKRAVVLSNATTKVAVGGVEYTVAEAIECKNHGVEFKKALRNRMVAANTTAQSEFNRHSGDIIEKAAEQYVLSVIAAQPKDSKMSINDDAMKALRETYIKNNSYDMIDPLGVAKIIEELADEINEFEVEVDAALSVSNAITTIEFSY